MAKKVTKKDQECYLKYMLSHSRKWAITCLEWVYSCQTSEEKADEDFVQAQLAEAKHILKDEFNQHEADIKEGLKRGVTIERNGIGFTRFDAKILTSLCEFYREKGRLSNKQWELLFKKITKYWKQFMKHPDFNEDKFISQVTTWKEKQNMS